MAAQQGVPNFFDLKKDERNRIIHAPPPSIFSRTPLSLGSSRPAPPSGPPPAIRLPPEIGTATYRYGDGPSRMERERR